MDWTGGVRRRFAPRKDNAMKQRQRAYFAKARSALQKPPGSKGSFKPAYCRPAAAQSAAAPTIAVESKRSSDRKKPRRSHSSRQNQESGSAKSVPEEARRKAVNIDHVIHITSSSLPSAPSVTSIKSSAAAPRPRPSITPFTTLAMKKEEKLIAANRRRLLAQSDWLGLAATKPVHMNFQSRRDKERIGKRRKVANSTSRKGQPAVHRVLTPLFGERLRPEEPMMCGALSPADIDIQIGTDALATQTQRSFPVQTPRLATGRRPSTELGPLSEEPMLLGDDGDSYEALPSPARQHDSYDSHVPFQHSQTAETAEGQWDHEDHYQVRSPPMQPYAEEAQMCLYSHSRREHGDDVNIGMERNGGLDPASADDEGSTNNPFDGTKLGTQQQATLEMDDKSDDEAFWRRLMRFEQHTPSNSSIKALKSSSLHVTTSDGSHRPVISTKREQSFNNSGLPSTSKGAGTLVSSSGFASGEEDLPSPSASLKQIRRLLEQHTPAAVQHGEDADEEATWRQFIIGSQFSSSISLRDEEKGAPYTEDEAADHLEPSLSMMNVSGLGTSVASIFGDTQDTQSHHQRRMPQQVQTLDELHSQQYSPKQTGVHDHDMIRTMYDIDVDTVENNRLPSGRHVRPVGPRLTNHINSKHFQTINRRTGNTAISTPGIQRGKRVPKRAKPRAKVHEHSVYDLIYSDGASLA